MKRRNFSGQTTRLANMIRTISLSTVLATSFVSTAFAETVSATQTAHYDIAANDLGAALAIFATQSGVVLSFDTDLTKGLKSTDLKGEYSIVQGFEQLLKGTHLQLLQRADGSLTLEKIQAKPQPVQARDMGQLKAIDVTASASRRAVTNDTNVAQLPVITVNAEQNGSAEDGYLVKNITGVGIWGERSLQDTPYSMNIVSGELIENVIAKDMQQIFKMNPITQESSTNNFLSTTIRGLNVQNPIVNGIPYTKWVTTIPMIQDISRVEIINGATGFLYGGGRVGGAVNYVTKKPTVENLKTVSIGSYGAESYFAHIDLSGQFDKNNIFGYRVNAFYQDGELPNTQEIGQKAISLVFDWKPMDNFYTDVKYSHKDILTKGANPYFSSIDDRSSIKSNKIASPYWIQHHIKSDKFENSINWNINDILTLRTALFYEEMQQKAASSNFNYINNKINISNRIWGVGAWQEVDNYGSNVYLDIKFDTSSINHTLTMGYSLNSSKEYAHSDGWVSYILPNGNYSFRDFKHLSKPYYWTNYLGEITTLGSQPLKASSKAQYQNILIGDDIVFNEQWSALVGVNYATSMSKNYSTNVKYDKSKLTPTLSIIYKPFKKLTTYATYIESLEVGSIVGTIYKNSGTILDPYTSKQYELGTKYSFLDEKVLLTSAIFKIEKENQYEDNTTTPKTLTQDGEQTHQGLELTITGKVIDDLTIIAGGTLLDLNVEKASDKSLEGKKPTNAATKMAKIFAEYSVPTIDGLSLSVGAYYTGKRYADSANSDILPAYTSFDMGARYLTKLWQYTTSFNLNIQNLTDKVYWKNGDMLGDPRAVAFSIKTQF